MKFEFILAKSAEFPVLVLCSVLSVSRSGFYAWRMRPAASRVLGDAQLAADITRIFRRMHGAYGSPRIHAELQAKGIRVSRKRVERLMRQNGLKAHQKRRFRKTTDSNHSFPIAPNVLERLFDVEAPNSVWVTDVTYIATTQGWLYLALRTTSSMNICQSAADANSRLPRNSSACSSRRLSTPLAASTSPFCSFAPTSVVRGVMPKCRISAR